MKSFTSSEASASKSSGSHKKSSSVSSKSKSKKSSQSPANSSTSADPAPSTSDRSRYKNYAGISSRSVKCYWEQHEKNETDVSGEACSRVAEDVTYKLWELGNTLKTYARHADGRVTVDLVNEALKDASVCPVLGAGSSEWDTIEYDGVYHFNKDRIVDLREEYLKEVQVTTSRVDICSSWLAEESMSDHLLDFVDHLCDAIFLGDEETFSQALRTVATNPYVGCIVSLLLNKCTELLSFEYKPDTLRRAMDLLVTLTRNPFARDAEINSEMHYLCQIMVCLLLGPQATFSPDATTGDFQANPADLTFHEYHGDNGHVNVATIENHPHAAVVDENLLNTITGIKQESSMYNGIDITDIKNECETFFIMMENNGLEMKQEHDGDQQQSNIEDPSLSSSCPAVDPVPGPSYSATDEAGKCGNVQAGDLLWREDECGVITTQMCDLECVDKVCECLGRLGSFWGLAERRCCNLIRSRLKEFFTRDCIQLHWEFEWLIRVFRAMWALGENPFREFSAYLERVDSISTPDWVLQEFSVAAVYICGHGDSYLYELLYTLSGDSVLPFMIYNTKKLHKIAIKSATESHIKYKIASKVLLKTCPRLTVGATARGARGGGVDEYFERYDSVAQRRIPPRIGFRFAGCRPVPLPRKASHAAVASIPIPPVQVHQNADLLGRYNRRIVVARRKLFTSLTNRRLVRHVDDLRCMNL
uniref:Uncharacterized protein n=2 Tax=Lutzomyia longipalpis TaxID=7200 RepID=A0A1B0CEG0_LUTLO